MANRRIGCVALGAAIVALGFASMRTKAPSNFVIEPEPIAEPTVTRDVEPAQGALAAPSPIATTPKRTPSAVPAPLELDYVEPWTGVDLKPVVVAARASRASLERNDPWDPRIIHDVTPGIEPKLMTDDPWGDGVGSHRAPSRAKVAQRGLEKDSPWAAD